MNNNLTVKLKKIIDEFHLENIYVPDTLKTLRFAQVMYIVRESSLVKLIMSFLITREFRYLAMWNTILWKEKIQMNVLLHMISLCQAEFLQL